MLHIGSGPGLFFILLRQGKEQTVAPLSYIFTLPLLKRLLNTINIPRLKRLQLADILWLIRVVLISRAHMLLVHFGKCLIHLSEFD